MRPKLTKIGAADFAWLDQSDDCWHCGEYKSEAGYQAGEINNQISNLKKSPTSSSKVLYWKQQAINYWGDRLRELIPHASVEGRVTFVPMPGSKPVGHPEHDDRMLRVLQRMAAGNVAIDVRAILQQDSARAAQHHGQRLHPTEIASLMSIDYSRVLHCKPTIVLVDDVITRGASFAAAKRLLLTCPGVTVVHGVFLARAVRMDSF